MQEQDIQQLVTAIVSALRQSAVSENDSGPRQDSGLGQGSGDQRCAAQEASLPSVSIAPVISSETAERSAAGQNVPGHVVPAEKELGRSENVETAPLPDITTPEYKKKSCIENPHKPDVLAELQKATNARIATGKCGCRPPTSAYLRFLADHARSKGTVFKEVSPEWLEKNGLWSIKSLVEDKNQYLTRPDLGRLLSAETIVRLKERYPTPSQVQIVLSDGLSTDALLSNYEEMLPPLVKGLKNAGLTVGEPFFLHYGRVKAEDVIGEAIGCDVLLLLIGERPGLGQSESMSCYAVYRPSSKTVESQRTVISNIHKGGIPPVEAAAVIVELACNILRHQASGIDLNKKTGGGDV